jgi:hypothetical protein
MVEDELPTIKIPYLINPGRSQTGVGASATCQIYKKDAESLFGWKRPGALIADYGKRIAI